MSIIKKKVERNVQESRREVNGNKGKKTEVRRRMLVDEDDKSYADVEKKI